VKEFAVYTVLRLVLFAATFAVVLGLGSVLFESVNVFLAVVISFVVSGIGSYFGLERQRSAFAVRVEQRAARAAASFEEMRAKEDADEA
jgi:hypothetical protein